MRQALASRNRIGVVRVIRWESDSLRHIPREEVGVL